MGDFVFAQVVANARAEEQDKRQRKASKAERQRIKQLERELQYKDKALVETAALLTLSKKSQGDLGPQRRGRMTSLPGRQHTVALIEQAQRDGARLEKRVERSISAFAPINGGIGTARFRPTAGLRRHVPSPLTSSLRRSSKRC